MLPERRRVTWALFIGWLKRFALTQAVELPVYWLALAPRPAAHRLAIGFAASALTHPLVVFALHPALAPLGEPWRLLAMEGLVVAFEGWWLRRFGVRDPWLWALVANAASVAVGATLAGLAQVW